MPKKIALVYYSRRGSTAKLAAKLAESLSVSPVVLKEDAPRDAESEAGIGGLSLAAAAIAAKLGLKGRLKPFTAEIAARIADADTVVLGTPVWASSLPPAVNSFIAGRLKPGATVFSFGTMLAPTAEKAVGTLRKRVERSGCRFDESLFVRSTELDSEETARRIERFLSLLS